MFVSTINPTHDQKTPALWFIYHGNKLLVTKENKITDIPFINNIALSGITILRAEFLGYLDEKPCYTAEFDSSKTKTENFTFKSLRSLYNLLPEEIFSLAGRAFQIMDWDRTHQFCSACGAQTIIKPGERAKICGKCELLFYPRISPAVIIAVTRENEILLARSGRFAKSFYSVLAGFVEPGESLEDCISREIMEEVGIKVKNIQYFGSQPWPFPNSLMIGFTAEHSEGEIIVDKKELEDARWFRAGNLPEIPPGISIARGLIERFVEKNS